MPITHHRSGYVGRACHATDRQSVSAAVKAQSGCDVQSKVRRRQAQKCGRVKRYQRPAELRFRDAAAFFRHTHRRLQHRPGRWCPRRARLEKRAARLERNRTHKPDCRRPRLLRGRRDRRSPRSLYALSAPCRWRPPVPSCARSAALVELTEPTFNLPVIGSQ